MFFYRYFLYVSLLASFHLFAKDDAARLHPSNDEFWQIIHHQYEKIKNTSYEPEKISGNTYVDIGLLKPGQDEFSIRHVMTKLKKDREELGFYWDDKKNEWHLNFSNGLSLLPLKDSIQVIKAPMGLLILDGHHHVFMSYFVGAKKIPVQVIEDLHAMSNEDFWDLVHEKKYIYFKKPLDDIKEKTLEMIDCQDNPNRYLANLLSTKIKMNIEDFKLTVTDIKPNQNAAWIKINDGPPFIELKIAHQLKKSEIEYQDHWQDKIPSEIVQKSRDSILILNAQEKIIVLKDQKEANLVAKKDKFLCQLLKNLYSENSYNCFIQ